MEQKNLEKAVENLFLIMPLFKKKFDMYDLYEGDTELSPSHFHILFILEETEASAITGLARALMISKTNVTPLVQKLIDMELIERIYDSKDRRFIHVRLTAQGKSFMQNHKALVIETLRKKLSGLDLFELDKLANSLEVLREVLYKIE